MTEIFQELIQKPIAFKEWSLICEALGAGRQHIILRKGGIHEGQQGFAFQHQAFFLFPTLFHEQDSMVRWQPEEPPLQLAPSAAEIPFCFWAQISFQVTLHNWEQAQALAPFHVWREELIRERFDFGGNACIHAALVRVFALRPPLTLSYQPNFGGCRSWISLPKLSLGKLDFQPAIPENAFQSVQDQILSILAKAESATSS